MFIPFSIGALIVEIR